MKKVNLILALVAVVNAVMAGALLATKEILTGVLYIFLALLFLGLSFTKKTPVNTDKAKEEKE